MRAKIRARFNGRTGVKAINLNEIRRKSIIFPNLKQTNDMLRKIRAYEPDASDFYNLKIGE